MNDTPKITGGLEDKFFAIISYISFFCIVSLLLKKDDKFVLYHAKQGLVLFLFEVLSGILTVVPFLGPLISTVGFVLFSLIALWGIFQVLMGNYARIPIISDIADKIKL